MTDLPPIGSIQAIDERAVRAHRAERIRHELRRQQHEAVLVVDPVNLRYATGTRNMQVWTMHNIVRYALIFADGPTVLFDLATGRHLSAGLESVSEVRPSVPFDYMLVADNADPMAARWAAQIRETLREHGCAADTLAVDRADTLMVRALDALGTRVVDGKSVLEHARAIKSAEEIRAFRASLATCEASVRSLHEFAGPGITESEAFGHLVGESIARGGEYPETRLLTAGPRTNPWFQEAFDRAMQAASSSPSTPTSSAPWASTTTSREAGSSAAAARPVPRRPSSTSPASRSPTTSISFARASPSSSTRPGRSASPTPTSPIATPTSSTAAGLASSIPSSSIPRTRTTGCTTGASRRT